MATTLDPVHGRIDYKVIIHEGTQAPVVSHVTRFYNTEPYMVGTLVLELPDFLKGAKTRRCADSAEKPRQAKKNREGS